MALIPDEAAGRLLALLADEPYWQGNGGIGLRGFHSHNPFDCHAPDAYGVFCKHVLAGECTNERCESDIDLRNELRHELLAALNTPQTDGGGSLIGEMQFRVAPDAVHTDPEEQVLSYDAC